jgi:hypothetical protein
MGKLTQALSDADDVAALGKASADNLVNLAFVFARAAQGIGADANIAPPERDKLQVQYADRAMSFLKKAVSEGYRNTAVLRQDHNLDSLRAREDFKQLLANL